MSNETFFQDDSYVPELDGQGYPSVAYIGSHARLGDHTKPMFLIEKEKLDTQPKGWESFSWRFGTDPNADEVECWMTRELKCVIVDYRRRASVRTDTQTFYYHYMEKRANREIGKYTQATQLLLKLEGVDEFVSLGLSGKGRQSGWSNNPKGQYGIKGMPLGVAEQLTKYCREMTKKYKLDKPLPFTYAWNVILLPLERAKGKPKYVEFGRDDKKSFFCPLTMKWPSEKLSDRYVGKEEHARLADLVSSGEVKEWREQWDSFDNSAASNNQLTAIGDDEDEIPWTDGDDDGFDIG